MKKTELKRFRSILEQKREAVVRRATGAERIGDPEVARSVLNQMIETGRPTSATIGS